MSNVSIEFQAMTRNLLLICSLLVPLASTSAVAQEGDLSAYWNGIWNAEGTMFTIAVEVTDGVMQITKLETLGFDWSNEAGIVDGNTVQVAVEYAGVTGIIHAELIDANTAIVSATSCEPDYMVVCALSKNRQAIFRRVETPE